MAKSNNTVLSAILIFILGLLIGLGIYFVCNRETNVDLSPFVNITDMSLVVETEDGEYYYLPEQIWDDMSSSQKKSLKRKGLVVSEEEENTYFVLALIDYTTDQQFSFNSAIEINNIVMPDVDQARLIVREYQRINEKLRAFGAQEMSGEYWTCSSVGNRQAWAFNMTTGVVSQYNVSVVLRVRGIVKITNSKEDRHKLKDIKGLESENSEEEEIDIDDLIADWSPVDDYVAICDKYTPQFENATGRNKVMQLMKQQHEELTTLNEYDKLHYKLTQLDKDKLYEAISENFRSLIISLADPLISNDTFAEILECLDECDEQLKVELNNCVTFNDTAKAPKRAFAKAWNKIEMNL